MSYFVSILRVGLNRGVRGCLIGFCGERGYVFLTQRYAEVYAEERRGVEWMGGCGFVMC
jgi:hypothetical protein